MVRTTEAKIVFVGEDKTGAAARSASSHLDSLQARVGSFGAKMAGAATAIAGLVGTLGLLEKVRGSIEILDKLDEFAEKTGNSVERLSELRYAGEVAGTPFDALTGSLSRLNKQMAEAAGGNKEAQATFKALGVEVANADGSLRSNADVLLDIADKFSRYEDGPAKAALAQRLFGKSGEEMIPILNQGREGIAKLSQEAKQLGAIYDGNLAKQAAAFNDDLTKIKLASEAAHVAISGPLISALADLSSKFVEVKKNAGFWDAFKAAVGQGANRYWADVGKMYGVTTDFERQRQALANLLPGDENDAVYRRWIRPATKVPEATPIVKTPGAATPKDDPTKKLLENSLKELQRGADQERELLQQRVEMFDLFQVKELISISDYYERRQGVLDEATRGQIKAYDEQIAAVRAYMAAADKQTDRAEAEGKLSELIDKRAKVEREAGVQGLKLESERLKSTKDYGDALNELSARLDEVQGRLSEAAAIRFDKQNEDLRRLLNANDNRGGLAQLEALKRFQIGQAELTRAQQGAALVQGDLQLAEERITLARERGTIGELAGLRASGEARRQALVLMDEQLSRLDKLSAATMTPEQAQQADRLRLQREQLAAQLDPLSDRLNTIVSESFGSALTNALTGRASPREAIRQFLDGLATQVIDLGVKDLAATIFKGGDGGIGALLSRAFGGDKGLELGATPANALYVRLADLGSLGLAAGTSGGSGGGIAGLLANALGPLSNTSATTLANLLPGDSLDNLITLTGAFAGIQRFDVGTDYVPQDMLAMIHEGEKIVPRAYNPAAGGAGQDGGMVFSPVFHIDARADRAAVVAEVTRVTAVAQRQMIEELKRAKVLPQ